MEEQQTYSMKDEIVSLQRDGILPSLEGKSVLEIGPGRGFGSKILTELGALVTAVEMDMERVGEGIRMGNYEGVNLIAPADARNYSYDNSFDHIFGFHIGPLMNGGRETIPQDWKDILSNTTQYVKQDGFVLLSYHCAEDTDLVNYLSSIGIEGRLHFRDRQKYIADTCFVGKI